MEKSNEVIGPGWYALSNVSGDLGVENPLFHDEIVDIITVITHCFISRKVGISMGNLNYIIFKR